MTDNEIIKALECCRDNDNNLNMEKCFEVCPYDSECAGKFMQDVLSLINRQKEEIEGLKNRDLQVEVSEKLEREIKAEAVKEFTDRLKERASKGFWETDAYIGVEQIEELVKEMVGKNNA